MSRINSIREMIDRVLFCVLPVITVLFVVGIFLLNLCGCQWYNFDMYSDAMNAKYMAQYGSLFPENWIFGNQLYVVATPALAAVLYHPLQNAVLAMGTASCVMTLAVLCSFLWCVAPFTSHKVKIVGCFCIIGGTIFSSTAALDISGLQVFYTMASYYACYLAGILFTSGIFLRILYGKPVSRCSVFICTILNVALGMQSLREILVLNIPICLLSVFLYIFSIQIREDKRKALSTLLFGLSMLAAEILGYIIVIFLKKYGFIRQIDNLVHQSPYIISNLKAAVLVLLKYVGVYTQEIDSIFSVYKLICSYVLTGIVILAVTYIIKAKAQPLTPLHVMVLFCIISILSVIGAGTLVIEVRGIYYFVWYLLVAFSACLLYEKFSAENSGVRTVFLAFLVFIGTSNLFFNFHQEIASFSSDRAFYQEIEKKLEDEGIEYIYYDMYTHFQAPRIAALSDDKIICCPVVPNSTGTEDDLFKIPVYLRADDWYKSDNYKHSCLLLSEQSFNLLNESQQAALQKHLCEAEQFYYKDWSFLFFNYDEELFNDFING